MINIDMKQEILDAQRETPGTMTRKEALVRAGKYAAFTAAGMMLVLSPRKAVAESVNQTGPQRAPEWPSE